MDLSLPGRGEVKSILIRGHQSGGQGREEWEDGFGCVELSDLQPLAHRHYSGLL
jgi:hypothetical protein